MTSRDPHISHAAVAGAALCVVALAASHLAMAAKITNSSRSNKTNMLLPPEPNEIATASGIAVALTQTRGGSFRAKQETKDGKATFGRVPDGAYSVAISPATGPAGSVGGLSVMWTTGANVVVVCEAAARKDNSFNCTLTSAPVQPTST